MHMRSCRHNGYFFVLDWTSLFSSRDNDSSRYTNITTEHESCHKAIQALLNLPSQQAVLAHHHNLFVFVNGSFILFIETPQVKFNDYAKNIAETKQHMSTDSSNAFFSMTQAEYAAGEFKQKVAEGSMTARIRVGAGVDNVAGVKLPVFTKVDTGAAASNQSLGLVGGGKKIQQVREKFTVLLDMLIK